MSRAAALAQTPGATQAMLNYARPNPYAFATLPAGTVAGQVPTLLPVLHASVDHQSLVKKAQEIQAALKEDTQNPMSEFYDPPAPKNIPTTERVPASAAEALPAAAPAGAQAGSGEAVREGL